MVNHKHKQLMFAVIRLNTENIMIRAISCLLCMILKVSDIDVYIEVNLNIHVTAIKCVYMYLRSIFKTSKDNILSIILIVTYVLMKNKTKTD